MSRLNFVTADQPDRNIVVTAEPDGGSPGFVDVKLDGIAVAFFSPSGGMWVINFIANDPDYLALEEKGVHFVDVAEGGRSIKVE